jgi:glyoxylase-like metal-dependent hydrolase (beta-lactamase superfamily II)
VPGSEPRIHHLNCGTMCPLGGRLIDGRSGLVGRGKIVCHVLLIETAKGLLLIDTGLGTRDVRERTHLGRPFRALTLPVLSEQETAIAQVRALGFDPQDVRTVVLTHLDVDHAGGLVDFPAASVHLWSREKRAAESTAFRERFRYRPLKVQAAHGPKWVEHELDGDDWFGFRSIRAVSGTDAEVLLIPLPGHTLGHTGVAVRRGDRWLLHCGDAYFHERQLKPAGSAPAGLRAFIEVVTTDRKLRIENEERLRELASRHGDEVELISAHDAAELERCQQRA